MLLGHDGTPCCYNCGRTVENFSTLSAFGFAGIGISAWTYLATKYADNVRKIFTGRHKDRRCDFFAQRDSLYPGTPPVYCPQCPKISGAIQHRAYSFRDLLLHKRSLLWTLPQTLAVLFFAYVFFKISRPFYLSWFARCHLLWLSSSPSSWRCRSFSKFIQPLW